MEQKVQGGKRRGAGRKPVLNKKKQISLYVESGKIIKFGNEEKMKEKIYAFIEEYGKEAVVIPINYSVASPEAYDSAKNENPVHDELPVFFEPKSPVTGLPPKLSDFDKFSDELRKAKSRQQVEAIMRQSVGGIMFPRERIALKSVADEVLLDMFND